MLRLSANISTLFTEWTLLDRPAAAADAGFRAVEMQFPYAEPAQALAAACRQAKVAMILFNLPAGRLDLGELGVAGLPDRRAEFLAGIEQAANYAAALDCRQVNCLAGHRPPGVPHALAWATLVDNLREAADRLARQGIRLLVEPLNRHDWPDFLLAGLAETDALIAAVAHPNLAIQYDAYHMHAAGENWLDELCARAGTLGHIQFSDHPGRHEPGSGIMDMAALFAAIAASPYTGWTGAEYRPRTTTLDSLAWLPGAQAACS